MIRRRFPWLSYLLVGTGAVLTVVPFADMLMSIPSFRRDLFYAAWHLWPLWLRASMMIRSNS
ncbi:hypothetical protein AB0D87_48595, partial [Streptomyces sp. NPDC048342]